MKSFVLACMTALAVSQDPEVTNGTVVEMNQATRGDVTMSGSVQEVMTDDGSKEQIVLTAQFETGGGKWDDNSWLQNFLEFPNPSKPGEFIGATCNTKYTQGNGTSSKITIETMAGESLSNAAAGGGRMWRDYGIAAPETLFEQVAGGDAYQGTYAGRQSSQACAVQAVLWELVDGEGDNATYWDLKNGPALSVTAGFRLWDNKDDATPSFKADAEPFTYQLFDFGLEEPQPEVIVPDEVDETTGGGETTTDESGAAALATMGAAAIAALLFA